MKTFLLAINAVLVCRVFGQEDILMVDRAGSPFVGAENVITIHRNLYSFESKYIPARLFDESDFDDKILGILYRSSKSFFLDNILDSFLLLFHHDFFGHGWRARDYSFENIKYEFAPAVPYGDGYGLVSWKYPKERMTTIDDITSTFSGGIEATTVLSNRLRFKWLQQGVINYREASLYTLGSNDMTLYVVATKMGIRGIENNDITNYLYTINFRYEIWYSGTELTLNKLNNLMLINLLNPFQYYSLYAFFASYLWSGKEEFGFPMIHIGRMRYLPSARVGLTTFGPEMYLENFLVDSAQVMNFYLRHDLSSHYSFFGVGFEGFNIVNLSDVDIDVKIDVWTQPSLYLGGQEITTTRKGLGGAFYIRAWFPVKGFDFLVNAGYKTAGFLEGESLREGPIVRLGVRLDN